ncbi:MAG: leucine-rich repeat domain-containing protein, partial [Clostridia bacterium]|nr:leucine-rich repeat domain-containing protein [Clostridia bacterium]
PDTLEMQVGETVLLGYEFEPAGWSNSIRNGHGWDDDFLSLGWDESEGKNTLTAIQPGITQLNIEVYDYNLNVSIYKTITVRIADENGDMPWTELNISVDETEKTWALAPTQAEDGMPQSLSTVLLRAEIEYYDELADLYDGTPNWSVTQIAGTEIVTWSDDMESAFGLYCGEMPSAEDTLVYEVTCSWGGQTAVETVTIHFVDMELPTGLSIPDVLNLQVGETIELDYGFTPQGWGSGQVKTEMGFWEDTFAYLSGRFSGTPSLTGTKAGVTHVTFHVIDQGYNISVTKYLTVRITDDGVFTQLVLPAGLTAIEAEAFCGIAADSVVIPEGCTTIGSRAFADCADLIEIVIPASVTSIADDAFDGSDNLTIVSSSFDLYYWAKDRGIHFLWN